MVLVHCLIKKSINFNPICTFAAPNESWESLFDDFRGRTSRKIIFLREFSTWRLNLTDNDRSRCIMGRRLTFLVLKFTFETKRSVVVFFLPQYDFLLVIGSFLYFYSFVYFLGYNMYYFLDLDTHKQLATLTKVILLLLSTVVPLWRFMSWHLLKPPSKCKAHCWCKANKLVTLSRKYIHVDYEYTQKL